MQILLFVLTIIMVLTLLTYARIDNYVGFVLTRKQLEQYMAKTEREFPSLRNIKWYEDTPATKKEADDAQKKSTQATSKVNLYALISKDVREEDFDLHNQVRYVTKRLIEQLYEKSSFYQELRAKRRDFVNEILTALENTAKGQNITNAKDLANIDLGDKQLNDAFYFILKGTKREDSRKDALEKVKDQKSSEESDVDDGYLSLIDFITIDKGRQKLRVFLASRQTLMAITGNKELVDEIFEKRLELYNQVKNDTINDDEASQRFEQLFGNRISSVVNNALLDYTVTKTNPEAYQ